MEVPKAAGTSSTCHGGLYKTSISLFNTPGTHRSMGLEPITTVPAETRVPTTQLTFWRDSYFESATVQENSSNEDQCSKCGSACRDASCSASHHTRRTAAKFGRKGL